MGFIDPLLLKLVSAGAVVQSMLRKALWRGELAVWCPDHDEALLSDIKSRLRFYLPAVGHQQIRFYTSFPLYMLAIGTPVLQYFPERKIHRYLCRLLPRYRYRVDHRTDVAGWEFCRLVNDYHNYKPETGEAKDRFVGYLDACKKNELKCCYVFGTGPSLSEAAARNWEDGYRVVCNTLVRDGQLWHHINPHVIVAGDAIYHFSFTSFATAFRSDLKRRLAETDTLFVYPDRYDALVQREFKEFRDRLVPIPVGTHRKIHVNLCEEFLLPAGGNVLPTLLLPVACSFAKSIKLWGFNGRSPNDGDVPFWANSAKQNYPELMHTLKESFPGFFNKFVPGNDSNHYIESVQGGQFEQQLSAAEAEGYGFTMLHRSWTPTLSKRFFDEAL